MVYFTNESQINVNLIFVTAQLYLKNAVMHKTQSLAISYLMNSASQFEHNVHWEELRAK